jgi:tetratricopeptide (TPR) repeat protein
MALVVQGTSRKHYNYNGGILSGRGKDTKAVFDDMRKKEGVVVINQDNKGTITGPDGKPKVDVAGGKGTDDDPDKSKKLPNLDPTTIWQDALARGKADPGLVVATADFLFEEGYFDHAVEFLKANLRQGVIVQPWVYEALALAMEFNRDSMDDILRVRLSATSLDPKNAQSYLKAAKACSDSGNNERAMSLCRQAAQLDPNIWMPYADALVYADRSKDAKGMEWAVSKLSSQDWATDNITLQLKARKSLDNLTQVLQKENRGNEAAKLKDALARLKVRDVVVNITWDAGVSGNADLEMEILEPCGTLCSSQVRQSPGGGIMAGFNLDTMSEKSKTKGTYTAAEAFSGEYTVRLTRLWGQPANGKVKLEIIHHQGTPQEKHRFETVTIDREATVKFVLADGRRKDVAEVNSAAAQPRQTVDDQAKYENVMTKLRELADPVNRGGLPRGVSSGVSKSKGLQGIIPALVKADEKSKSKEQLIYQDGTSTVGGGMLVTTQTRISPDGQYMRLSLQPVFQPNVGAATAPRINLSLIPGGNDQ